MFFSGILSIQCKIWRDRPAETRRSTGQSRSTLWPSLLKAENNLTLFREGSFTAKTKHIGLLTLHCGNGSTGDYNFRFILLICSTQSWVTQPHGARCVSMSFLSLTSSAWASLGFFPRGAARVFFQKFSSGGPKWQHLFFPRSKLRKQFFLLKFSKSPPAPLLTPVVTWP